MVVNSKSHGYGRLATSLRRAETGSLCVIQRLFCVALFASTVLADPAAEPSAEDGGRTEATDRRESPEKPRTVPQGPYDEITVTASPLGRSLSELATPAEVLSDEALRQRQESTLGETLSSEPGVSSTYFGPNASRPIIRGLGGDHIRILNNGIGPLDASAASPDHAVSIDPLNVKRIEIVRGPAALLYGPTAIGGAVNLIDNRIPDERIPSLLSGILEPRWNSASSEWGGAAVLEGGYRGLAFHLDGLGRDTKNIVIPGFARSARLRASDPLPEGEVEAEGRLPNSKSSTQAGSWGASYIWDGGYFGVAPSWYHSDYGTVAEREVSIKLDQPRLDVAGAFNSLVPHLTSLKYKLGLSDYEHTEFEGAEVGTKFKNRGWDGRIDGIHDAIGPFEGAIGVETVGFTFSALGEEAFVPETTNRITSGFIFEEMKLSPVRLQFGGRVDYSSAEASADPNFGPGSTESFATGSGSVGAVYSPIESYPVALSVSYTSRAPTYEELFANGPHVATGQFEVGDRNLSVEHALGVDLSVRKTVGRVTGFVTGFYNHIDDFIFLIPTGENHPFGDGEELPIFEFRNIPAEFIGFEAGTTIRVVEWSSQALDLDLGADYVHSRNRDTGEPLPQIPPFRFHTRFLYGWEQLHSVFEIVTAAKQDRNAENELPTDGYTVVNLSLEYNLMAGPVGCDLLVRGNNLNDAEVRDSTSVLKDIAPLPGRGVSGGMRLTF